MKKICLLLCVVLFIVLCSGQVLAGTKLHVYGIVTDEEGRKVNGLTVKLYYGSSPAITATTGYQSVVSEYGTTLLSASNGVYNHYWSGMPSGTYKITVTKSGYLITEQTVSLTVGTPKRVDLVLVPQNECEEDNDCPPGTWDTTYYCVGKDVWKSYKKYICDPCTIPPRKCIVSTFNQIDHTCALGCSGGVCLNHICGDGNCDADESFATCPQDCKECTSSSNCASSKFCNITNGCQYKIGSGNSCGRPVSGETTDLTCLSTFCDPIINVCTLIPTCGDGNCYLTSTKKYENYSSCPSDCCMSDCTAYDQIAEGTDNKCHSECNGYKGCSMSSTSCNKLAKGASVCADSLSLTTCCEGPSTACGTGYACQVNKCISTAVCGDGTCTGSETQGSCPVDCVARTLMNDPQFIRVDTPWRVEPSTNIPVLLFFNLDENEGGYNVHADFFDVYLDTGKDQSDNPTNDQLLFRDTINKDILHDTKYDMYKPGQWQRSYGISPSGMSGTVYLHTITRFYTGLSYFEQHDHFKVNISTAALPKLANWYAGDTHYHSSYSDSGWTVNIGGNEIGNKEMGNPINSTKTAASAMGLDWVAITDHSFDLNPASWAAQQSEISAYSSSNLRLIPGEEISCYQPYTALPAYKVAAVSAYGITAADMYVHTLGIGQSTLIEGGEWESGTWQMYTPEECISQLESQDSASFAAHPSHTDTFRTFWSYSDLINDDLSGAEGWNYNTIPDYDALRPELTMWDNLLNTYTQSPDGKIPLFAGGSDAHGEFNSALGKVRTYVYSPSGNSQSAIVDALQNGTYFVSDGPMLIFEVDGHPMGSEVTVPDAHPEIRVIWKSTPEFGKVDHIDIMREGKVMYNTDTAYYISPVNSPALDDYDNSGGPYNFTDPVPVEKNTYYRAELVTDKGYRAIANPIIFKLQCQNICDGICLSKSCYRTDPDCQFNGLPEIDCCGNHVCGLNEDYSICQQDCLVKVDVTTEYDCASITVREAGVLSPDLVVDIQYTGSFVTDGLGTVKACSLAPGDYNFSIFDGTQSLYNGSFYISADYEGITVFKEYSDRYFFNSKNTYNDPDYDFEEKMYIGGAEPVIIALAITDRNNQTLPDGKIKASIMRMGSSAPQYVDLEGNVIDEEDSEIEFSSGYVRYDLTDLLTWKGPDSVPIPGEYEFTYRVTVGSNQVGVGTYSSITKEETINFAVEDLQLNLFPSPEEDSTCPDCIKYKIILNSAGDEDLNNLNIILHPIDYYSNTDPRDYYGDGTVKFNEGLTFKREVTQLAAGYETVVYIPVKVENKGKCRSYNDDINNYYGKSATPMVYVSFVDDHGVVHRNTFRNYNHNYLALKEGNNDNAWLTTATTTTVIKTTGGPVLKEFAKYIFDPKNYGTPKPGSLQEKFSTFVKKRGAPVFSFIDSNKPALQKIGGIATDWSDTGLSYYSYMNDQSQYNANMAVISTAESASTTILFLCYGAGSATTFGLSAIVAFAYELIRSNEAAKEGCRVMHEETPPLEFQFSDDVSSDMVYNIDANIQNSKANLMVSYIPMIEGIDYVDTKISMLDSYSSFVEKSQSWQSHKPPYATEYRFGTSMDSDEWYISTLPCNSKYYPTKCSYTWPYYRYSYNKDKPSYVVRFIRSIQDNLGRAIEMDRETFGVNAVFVDSIALEDGYSSTRKSFYEEEDIILRLALVNNRDFPELPNDLVNYSRHDLDVKANIDLFLDGNHLMTLGDGSGGTEAFQAPEAITAPGIIPSLYKHNVMQGASVYTETEIKPIGLYYPWSSGLHTLKIRISNASNPDQVYDETEFPIRIAKRTQLLESDDSVVYFGNSIDINYTLHDADGNPVDDAIVKATIFDPSMKGYEVTLSQTTPGDYYYEFHEDYEYGIYHIFITSENSDGMLTVKRLVNKIDETRPYIKDVIAPDNVTRYDLFNISFMVVNPLGSVADAIVKVTSEPHLFGIDVDNEEIDVYNLQPGEERNITLRYYASDRLDTEMKISLISAGQSNDYGLLIDVDDLVMSNVMIMLDDQRTIYLYKSDQALFSIPILNAGNGEETIDARFVFDECLTQDQDVWEDLTLDAGQSMNLYLTLNTTDCVSDFNISMRLMYNDLDIAADEKNMSFRMIEISSGPVLDPSIVEVPISRSVQVSLNVSKSLPTDPSMIQVNVSDVRDYHNNLVDSSVTLSADTFELIDITPQELVVSIDFPGVVNFSETHYLDVKVSDGIMEDYTRIYLDGLVIIDEDSDGFASDVDCDDTNETIYPGATEIPYDSIDQDCDGLDMTDVDSDGYDAVCAGGDDCDDNDPSINPEIIEVCNAIDDNCDGEIDEGFLITSYEDADDDSYGNINFPITDCAIPSGYVLDSTDCDDTDDQVYPGATEICENQIDENCDGTDDICAAVDITPPNIYNLQTAESDNGPSMPYVFFTVVDIASGMNISSITVSDDAGNTFSNDDGNLVCTSIGSGAGITYSLDCILLYPLALSEGTHTITIVASDNAGNPAEATTSYDNTAPDLSITGFRYTPNPLKQDVDTQYEIDVYYEGHETIDNEIGVFINGLQLTSIATPGLNAKQVNTISGTTRFGWLGRFNMTLVTDYQDVIPESNEINNNYSVTFDVVCNPEDCDKDGYKAISAGGDDCDDNNPDVNPGMEEDCITVEDDDCSGTINDVGALNCFNFHLDTDHDSYGTQDSRCYCHLFGADDYTSPTWNDCDDSNKSISPFAYEDCNNGVDDDCDGLVDTSDDYCIYNDSYGNIIEVKSYDPSYCGPADQAFCDKCIAAGGRIKPDEKSCYCDFDRKNIYPYNDVCSSPQDPVIPEQEPIWCYQETANISTDCGGLDTGAYSIPSISANVENYLYVNYTKPVGALSSSKWQVKHGQWEPYNISFDADVAAQCWNVDQTLSLKILSYARSLQYGYSQAYCYNGASWIEVGKYNYTSGASAYVLPYDYKERLYDGDWNTEAFWDVNCNYKWAKGSGPRVDGARIFEEAMWWSIPTDETTEECTAEQSQVCDTHLKGLCASGSEICENGFWGPCLQDLRPVTEICDDTLDNDCDGFTDLADTDCQDCVPDQTQSCDFGLLGVCSAGTETCLASGFWGSCTQNVQPSAEDCDDFLDNDCDGSIDNSDLDCQECTNGNTQQCDTGLSGICSAGTKTCIAGFWDSCVQDQQQSTEICDNTLDDDCDGLTDSEDSDCTPVATTLCYQESANVSTACGGLDTGSYRFERTSGKNGCWTGVNMYINYSTPERSAGNPLWQIKTGGSTGLNHWNETIPLYCFNDGKDLQLKLYTYAISTIRSCAGVVYYERELMCLNSSAEWQVFDTYRDPSITGSSAAGTTNPVYAIDENWNTYFDSDSYDDTQGIWRCTSGRCTLGYIYEEAIWWNITV